MEKNKQKKINNNINNNINSDIDKAFFFINAYLPKHYVKKTISILGEEFSAENIRQVRNRNHNNLKIITALKKVAEDAQKQLS